MTGLWLLALGLVGPFVWGTVVARAFGRADEAKRRFAPPGKPKTDYSI